METKLNRRSLMQYATATVATLPLTSLAKAGEVQTDTELFAALKRCQDAAIALKAQADALPDDGPDDERVDAFSDAVGAHDELMFAAIETPAKTLEGFKAKVKTVSDFRLFGEQGPMEFAAHAGQCILADIETLFGPLPPQWHFPRA